MSPNKYCYKCSIKQKADESISNIYIFNIVNNIIFNSNTMPEIYDKMDNLKIDFDKWLERNNSGLNVFEWFSWYLSIKIKKYCHIKSKVYAFFQKVFSDNTISSIFTQSQIKTIINLKNPNTLLYHLVRYCENSNDKYYKRFYNLLIDIGSEPLTEEQLTEIKNLNIEEENIPDNLKPYISKITTTYKNIEKIIIQNIESNYPDYQLDKCIICNELIDYTLEIPKIINYAKNKNEKILLDLIEFAFRQRKSLNKIFNNYYETLNNNSDKNLIHKRHEHILDIYSTCLN
jgi:hypothetical protein